MVSIKEHLVIQSLCPVVHDQCGRSFDPNFLFLWPNARVSVIAPGHGGFLLPPGGEEDQEEEQKVNRKLKEESSAFFSSGRLWDDGIILPQDTRKVM